MPENDTIEEARMKLGKIKVCQLPRGVYSNPLQYESECYGNRYYYGVKDNVRIIDFALAKLERLYEEDKAIHEENIPVIEMNTKIRDSVRAFMKELGFPASWHQADPKSRARYPKMVTVYAGYESDLTKHCNCNDGWGQSEKVYNDYKAKFLKCREEEVKKAEFEKGKAERERAEELKKRKQDMTLASILVRYNLPVESDWDDVFDALCEKDPLLNLAVSMLMCREDWNDGCDSVYHATHSLNLKDDNHLAIYNDIIPLLSDFEDGRVFRDTTWNYDRIFGLVEDQQLVDDTLEAKTHAGK